MRTWLSEVRDLMSCVGLQESDFALQARPFNFHASVSPLLNVSAGAADPVPEH